MSAARVPRWALSFADLCLVLLAFFVLLQAERGNRAQLAVGMRAAFAGGGAPVIRTQQLAASTMFEPGEALLLPAARARLAAIGREAASSGAGIRIESVGSDPASARFDRWELAAARAAAIARGIGGGRRACGRDRRCDPRHDLLRRLAGPAPDRRPPAADGRAALTGTLLAGKCARMTGA